MQPGTVLLPELFPASRIYVGYKEDVELAATLAVIGSVIKAINLSGLLVSAKPSFGFAMADPTQAEICGLWNQPEKFVWLVGGYGPDAGRYICNAVRKLRAALRYNRDTLDIQRNTPGMFNDSVESQTDDGRILWGDFPWGGAVKLPYGGRDFFGAVSCFKDVEDHAVAAMVLGFIAQAMDKADGLVTD